MFSRIFRQVDFKLTASERDKVHEVRHAMPIRTAELRRRRVGQEEGTSGPPGATFTAPTTLDLPDRVTHTDDDTLPDSRSASPSSQRSKQPYSGPPIHMRGTKQAVVAVRKRMTELVIEDRPREAVIVFYCSGCELPARRGSPGGNSVGLHRFPTRRRKMAHEKGMNMGELFPT